MDPGLTHVMVVWIVPISESDSAISAHAHGFDEVWMHPYDHPLHWKLLEHYIYIYYGSVIHSEVDLGLSLVIFVLVYFIPSCKPDLAISAHTNGFDEVRMHPHPHPRPRIILVLILILSVSSLWSLSVG